jgi:hypothetical protein
LIIFLRQCISVAINRGNYKVQEADIMQAEKQYSEDQLQAVVDELRDINSEFAELPYAFIDSPTAMRKADLRSKIREYHVADEQIDKATNLLLWFGFLGIVASDGEEKYAHMYQYGVARMLRETSGDSMFVIHPAFRSVLACRTN